MIVLSPVSWKSTRAGVEREVDLGYIITDEQIQESRLAQTFNKIEEAQGKEKSAGQGCKVVITGLTEECSRIYNLRHFKTGGECNL